MGYPWARRTWSVVVVELVCRPNYCTEQSYGSIFYQNGNSMFNAARLFVAQPSYEQEDIATCLHNKCVAVYDIYEESWTNNYIRRVKLSFSRVKHHIQYQVFQNWSGRHSATTLKASAPYRTHTIRICTIFHSSIEIHWGQINAFFPSLTCFVQIY